jgi:mannosyltransferase OCH1-like enzyme
MPIPKIIYQVSINLDHNNPKIQNVINKMLEINPGYEYKLVTSEKEMDDFVNSNFEKKIVDAYNKLNILVAKIDFWRYLMLYKNGGIYLDMDSTILKPIDALIKEDDDAIISAEGNPNMFVQWALIFNKNHPILKAVIYCIIENITNNSYPNDVIKTTGTVCFSNAVNIIHYKFYNRKIRHNLLHKNADILFKNDGCSYRIFGIDYSGFFSFKYPESGLLYKNVKHWREQNIPLLK